MAIESIIAARALLEMETPLRADCGRLCDMACCRGEGEEGMYLFPGEDALYREAPWARVIDSGWEAAGKPVPLLICRGECPREERPLSCRLFPLTIAVEGDAFRVLPDPRAWALCPLMPHGLAGMSRDFVSAVEGAFAILWKDPEQRAFLQALDALLRAMRSFDLGD